MFIIFCMYVLRQCGSKFADSLAWLAHLLILFTKTGGARAEAQTRPLDRALPNFPKLDVKHPFMDTINTQHIQSPAATSASR